MANNQKSVIAEAMIDDLWLNSTVFDQLLDAHDRHEPITHTYIKQLVNLEMQQLTDKNPPTKQMLSMVAEYTSLIAGNMVTAMRQLGITVGK